MTDDEPALRSYMETARRLWNGHKFFEVHEILEVPWQLTKHERKREAARDPRRDGYHALILLAAAYVHWQRGNALGAQRKLEGAQAALKRSTGLLPGLDLKKFFHEVENDLRRANAGERFEDGRVPLWPADSA